MMGKVALLGNQNNNLFSVLRYLIDLGIDAELLLFNSEDNFFSFVADTYSPEKYNSRIKKLEWGDLKSWQTLSDEKIRVSLEKYDFLIGCGPAPAFISRIGRTLDIFIPYGADLYVLPFFQLVHPKRQFAYFYFSKYQRRGIETAKTILCDRGSQEFEKLFKFFKLQGKRLFVSPPFIYKPEYENPSDFNIKEADSLKKMRLLKEEGNTIIFQYCRQMWKTKAIEKLNILSLLLQKVKGNSLQAQMVSMNLKGNNKLIEGFALFINNNPNKKYKLILVEYGIDCDETKSLIRELEIDKYVVWLPIMPRKEIISCIKLSDIVVGELEFSYLTYGVVYETLLSSKPLIHYREDILYESEYGELYPMINANSSDTIFEQLKNIDENKIELNSIGKDGYKWISNMISNNVSIIEQLILAN